MSDSYSRFELRLEGMSCVKCAGRVEESLKSHDLPATNIRIDILTNIVLITIPNKELISQYTLDLESRGYKVKKTTDISLNNERNKRILNIKPNLETNQLIFEAFKQDLLGVIEVNQSGYLEVKISYNPLFIRGSEIIKHIEQFAIKKGIIPLFKLLNPFQDEDEIEHSDYNGYQVVICLICMVLLALSSLLPDSYTDMPKNWGMASLYMIFTIILTMVIMRVVGYSIFRTCLQQLTRGFNVNMITLISVGSGLAFIFGMIYLTLGILQMFKGTLHSLNYYIDNSAQHLQTSAAIFTSVVAGKYFQGKIKKKIVEKIKILKASLKVNESPLTRIIPKNKKYDILDTELLHPALIERDDIVKVSPGMLPFDGFIESGTVKLIENAHFGSEQINTRTKGNRVISGSQIISIEGEVLLRVTDPLEHTTAGKLFLEIRESTSGSSTDDKTSEQISKYTRIFIAGIFLIGFSTMSFWICAYIFGMNCARGMQFSYPFERAIAVLVASCPCALGTAIPMIYAIILRKALNNGVLVKESSSFDKLNGINTIVFDKTGTITGNYNIHSIQYAENHSFDKSGIWELISILEQDHLQHPIGLTLYQEALKKSQELGKTKMSINKNSKPQEQETYFGSEGIIDNQIEIAGKYPTVALGNHRLLSRLGIQPPKWDHFNSYKLDTSNQKSGSSVIENSRHFTSDFNSAEAPVQELNTTRAEILGTKRLLDTNQHSHSMECSIQINSPKRNNTSFLYLVIDTQILLQISVSVQETLKDNAQTLISNLKKKISEIHLLTGDNQENAVQTANYLGIDSKYVRAGVTPQEKKQYIDHLNKAGRKVMMVGDGINDLHAFKEATLSCTINFKSSQNLSFSNFVIIDNNIGNIWGLFKLAKVAAIMRGIIIVLSILYNIPIILSATGCTMIWFNFDLPGFMAAWAMFLSSITLTLVANLVECVNFSQNNRKKILNFSPQATVNNKI